MKPRRLALLALLALSPLAFAAEIGIEFSGVLTADGRTRIALTDTASKSTSWVESGAIFNGYRVDRYDANEDAVFLRKNGEEIRLGLVAAKTPEPSPSVLSASPNRAAASIPPSAAPPLPPPTAAPATATSAPAAAPASVSPPPLPTVSDTTTAPPAQTTLSSVAASDAPVSTAVPTTAPETIAQTPTPTGRLQAGASYRVQTGDTVESIALTHGVPTQQIRQLNPSLNSTSLRTGETIRIRPE